MAACAWAQERPLVLATGPEEGIYHALGRRLEGDPDLVVRSSDGSAHNLNLLTTGQADLAFTQQDLLVNHSSASELTVIGRIFFDYLHIFVREPLRVESAGDFDRLAVWLGDERSGTRYTSGRLLESLGLPVRSLPPIGHLDKELSYGNLPSLFRRGDLDAAMWVIALGSESVCEVMRHPEVQLFSLDKGALRKLVSEESKWRVEIEGEDRVLRHQSVVATIPKNTYPGQDSDIATVAVPVLLVTRREEVDERLRKLWKALNEEWNKLRAEDDSDCGSPREPERVPDLERSGLRLLALGDEPRELAGLLPKALLWLALAALFIGLVVVARRQQWPYKLRRKFEGNWLLAGLCGFLLWISTITIATYLLEREVNENFSSIPESFWSITIYLFSGLEDRNPYTGAGRFVAALGLILGPILFAVLTGWIASWFIKLETRMPRHLTDHCLILNWNERAIRVTQELHHRIVTERIGTMVIVALTDDDSLSVKDLRQRIDRDDAHFEDFYISVGDPTSLRALANANAQDARTVIILADDRLGDQADERTLRSIIMLRKLARQHGRDDLHVVAELINAGNVEVVDEIARDFPGDLEKISDLDMRTCLLAQAALSQGATGFYADLLRISLDTNEVYIQPIPEAAAQGTFRDYAQRLLAKEGPEPLLPVGLQRKENGRHVIYCNPKPDSPGQQLQPGDSLVLIAYQPPKPEDLV